MKHDERSTESDEQHRVRLKSTDIMRLENWKPKY